MKSRITLDICGRVKKARKDAQYTQKRIADALGIDRDKYKQYEKRTPLRFEYWDEFCKLTGVEIGWLMTGKQNIKPEYSAVAVRIMRLIEKQSPAKQKNIIGLLEKDR